MRIAIDLDGTAWLHREFFKSFTKAMKKDGHEIGILTAHSHDYRNKDLDLWAKRGFPAPDFYISMGDEFELIGEFKRWAVDYHRIDVLFDDFGGNNPDIEKSFMDKGELDFLVFKVIPGEK